MAGKALILARGRTYEVAYSCLTLALNIVVTAMISLRLLYYRYRMRRIVGEVEGSKYAGVVEMLVESAALVVVFNAFFVATVRSDSLVHYIAFAGNAQAQVCGHSNLVTLKIEVNSFCRSLLHCLSSFASYKGKRGRRKGRVPSRMGLRYSFPTRSRPCLIPKRRRAK